MKNIIYCLLLSLVCLGLNACGGGSSLPDPDITLLETDRGSTQVSYRLGENISFRVRANREGYVTLVGRDANNTDYLLQQNMVVSPNQITNSNNYTLTTGTLLGNHRVRAIHSLTAITNTTGLFDTTTLPYEEVTFTLTQ